MRQDDINIFESYQQIQQLNEAGVIRSKLAGMTDWGSLKNKIKSGISKAGAGTLNKLGIGKDSNVGKNLRKDAIEYRRAARNAAKDAKIKEILKIHSGQIEKLAKELVEDLDKLRLNRSGLTWETVNQHMLSMIKDELETQMSSYKKPKSEPEDIEYSEADTGGGMPVEAEPDVESEDEEKPSEPEAPKVVTYSGKPGKPKKPNNIIIKRNVIPFRFNRKDYMWGGINGWTYKGSSVDSNLQKAITDDFLKKFPKEVEFKK